MIQEIEILQQISLSIKSIKLKLIQKVLSIMLLYQVTGPSRQNTCNILLQGNLLFNIELHVCRSNFKYLPRFRLLESTYNKCIYWLHSDLVSAGKWNISMSLQALRQVVFRRSITVFRACYQSLYSGSMLGSVVFSAWCYNWEFNNISLAANRKILKHFGAVKKLIM